PGEDRFVPCEASQVTEIESVDPFAGRCTERGHLVDRIDDLEPQALEELVLVQWALTEFGARPYPFARGSAHVWSGPPTVRLSVPARSGPDCRPEWSNPCC